MDNEFFKDSDIPVEFITKHFVLLASLEATVNEYVAAHDAVSIERLMRCFTFIFHNTIKPIIDTETLIKAGKA
jgi:hypothetical protein